MMSSITPKPLNVLLRNAYKHIAIFFHYLDWKPPTRGSRQRSFRWATNNNCNHRFSLQNQNGILEELQCLYNTVEDYTYMSSRQGSSSDSIGVVIC